MYELINFDDKKAWQNVIESFKKNDIYFQWGYIRTFKVNGDGVPFIFYYEDENGRAANVFFVRDIGLFNIFKDKIEANKYFDIQSVYGYGGILYEGSDLEQLAKNYSISFNKYCTKANIISEFIRFNPLIENHRFLMNFYDVIPVRKTIYIDLSKGEDYIWDNLKSENRTRIRKAIKNGIEIEIGRDAEFIEKFIQLYYQTMDRDKAVKYYYFDKEFFYAYFKEFPDNAVIFAAKYNGNIISACLILFTECYVHYHFGGSNDKYMHLAPNNLLLYEVAKWASKRGSKKFHLGGGYSGSSDSLFRFKKSFSRLEPLDFYIGKKIHDQQAYDYLISIRRINDKAFDASNNYFPNYRG